MLTGYDDNGTRFRGCDECHDKHGIIKLWSCRTRGQGLSVQFCGRFLEVDVAFAVVLEAFSPAYHVHQERFSAQVHRIRN